MMEEGADDKYCQNEIISPFKSKFTAHCLSKCRYN